MSSTTNSNTAVRALAIAAGLGVVALLPLFVQDRFWLNLLVTVWIYTILALGLNVLFGFARQISFGHGGFFAIGAYTSALLSLEGGFNVWLAMAVATVAAGVLGYAIGRPLARLRGLSLAMATLAFGQMVFILTNQMSITGGPIGIAGIPAPELGPISFADSRNYYWLTAAVAMVVLVITRHICFSGVGRGLRALGVSEVAAEVAGVNTNAYKAATFVYSAGLAGLAGALFAHYFTFISSDAFGLDLSVLGVIIIVVGGLYSLWGALIGAFVITFLREYLRSYQEYSELVYGVLLIAIFMAAPNGIVGVGSYALTWARGLGRRDGRDGGAGTDGSDRDGQHGGMNVQEAVTIDRVGMRFGGLQALSDVSFELLPGRVTALIGPNGAGKTTAINIISGTMHPTSGAVRVDGKDVTRRKAHERRQISRTFQVPQALAGMTVLENVLVGMHVSGGYGFSRAALRTPAVRRAEVKARSRARDVLAELGLEDLAEQDACTLPLAQKRLLEVARALASDSGAILLDEVASGLTQREQEEMSQRVVDLRDRRLAVLVVEHNIRFVKSTADHLVVLNFGSVIFDGPVSEGLADSQVVKAYFGSVVRADS